MSTVESLLGCRYYSGLDIKGAFNNITIPDALLKYCGVITQDALFLQLRLTFGWTIAPALYQYVMNTTLDAEPNRPNHGTYMDDVAIGGEQVSGTWLDTLEAMDRLTSIGLPLNAWKL